MVVKNPLAERFWILYASFHFCLLFYLWRTKIEIRLVIAWFKDVFLKEKKRFKVNLSQVWKSFDYRLGTDVIFLFSYNFLYIHRLS